jgi:hypothetical protein
MAKTMSISDQIRALKPGEHETFYSASPGSIRTTVSRIRAEFGGRRKYHTQKMLSNVTVWRLK